MSSRKNKNKNRQNKPPIINLLQKSNVAPKPTENNAAKIFEEKSESSLKLEECTSKVVSDMCEVITPQPIESKGLDTDAPKKPKRNRGKKKKQDEDNDIGVNKVPLHVSEFLFEDTKIDPEIENNKNEAIECKETVEAASIMPVARKKKNENKKNIEPEIEIGYKYDDDTFVAETNSQQSKEKEMKLQIVSQEAEKVSSDDMKDDKSLPKTVEITEQESKSKKRNKKNKHRNDSVTSDKTEDITTSTTTFGKLHDVQSEDARNNETEMKSTNQEDLVNRYFKSKMKDGEIIKDTVTKTDKDLMTEKNTTALEKVTKQKVSIEEELKDSSAKSKKKNKKEKKQDVKLDIKRETREQGRINDEELSSSRSSAIDIFVKGTLNTENKDAIKTEIPTQHSSVETFEKEYPKPKAKIAKPVQTKNKDKAGVESVLHLPENITNVESTIDNKSPLIEIDSDLADAQNVTPKSENIIKSKGTLEEETIVIKEEKVTLESGVRDKNETTQNLHVDLDLITEISDSATNVDSAFIQIHEKCKIVLVDETDKQEIESPELLPSESVKVSSAREEDLEGLLFDTIPDFIEYPRSTSEQLDDNNNMIIQEITLIEEVKSDPPSDKSDASIFQISDESPIKSPEIVPVGLKVIDMEPKNITSKGEKTDLKSKVMEVNKDMEELKLSIEKSLAGLTAMETAEKEVEKQFEETTQYKTEGAKETEIKQNISDKIVDNVTCDAFGEEVFSHDKPEKYSNIGLNEQSKHEKCFDVPELPVYLERKDNKGKGKSKKKGKQETVQISVIAKSKDSESKDSSQSNKKTEESKKEPENADNKSEIHSTQSVEGTSDVKSADSVLSVVVDSAGSTETNKKIEESEERTKYTEDKSKKQSVQYIENLSDGKPNPSFGFSSFKFSKEIELSNQYKTEGTKETEINQNISDGKAVDNVTCDNFGEEIFSPEKPEKYSNNELNEQLKHEKCFDVSEPPVHPERKDNKGKGKSKKKGKQEAIQVSVAAESKDSESKDSPQSDIKTNKPDNTDNKSQKRSTHSVEGTSDAKLADSVLSVVGDSKDFTETKENFKKAEQNTEYTEDKSKKQSYQSVENLSDEKLKGGLSSTQITVITDFRGISSEVCAQTNEVMQETEEKAKSIVDKFEIQLAKSFEEKSEDNSTGNAMIDETWQSNYEPIENFEDALTSSVDDVNKTFEILANDTNHALELQSNVQINVIAPTDDKEKEYEKQKQEKQNPVSQPKNLLGHINIPVSSSKTDYKKEKNKTPNNMQAKAKIKDTVPIEDFQKSKKQSKESQTESKRKSNDKTIKESISCFRNDNVEYIYKYSFRRVFLPSACHVCKKDLNKKRVPCNFCNLLFYCNQKHKDEDWPHHQALCFAVSTIIHLKNQKHIYADAKNVTGQNYRLLRMQMIVSCEKVLKRKLEPWEQEALLYPRICADVGCREWRQGKLKDCETCGQISYCIEHPEHLPISHQHWCKSYNLYQKLVCYQQTKGRLEPKLPTRVMVDTYVIPEKINEVLASLYEEKIDMNDMQYAALTQLATAPLTTAFCYQLYNNRLNASYANGVNKKASFTLHIVGAELQFEADALNKWEIFLLHLKPDVTDLKVVFIGHELNPSNLPLDLLGKIRLCDNCRENKRRLLFSFQDRMSYHEYWASDDFQSPDIVCAFNSNLQNVSTSQNGKDPWTITIDCIMKLKIPFVLTSYTLSDLRRNLAKIKESSELQFNVISEPKFNSFASVRPDRNFISDDEMPLLFKNYCYTVICRDFY